MNDVLHEESAAVAYIYVCNNPECNRTLAAYVPIEIRKEPCSRCSCGRKFRLATMVPRKNSHQIRRWVEEGYDGEA